MEFFGDPQRLAQVVSNLLSNAIKFSPSGSLVRIEAFSKANAAIIRVCDNGPGIPVEEQGTIFEKFVQGSHQAGQYRGSGLGLAICRRIVELHGGEIAD